MTLPTAFVIQTEAALLPRVVLVDANVFFSPRLRDLFMTLHAHELVVLRWMRKIEEEWTRNVVRKHAAAVDALRACVMGMHKAVPQWEVVHSEGQEWAFHDVSPNDRHVAAAAYHLATRQIPHEAVALVTSNLRDFASSLLGKSGVQVMSPAAYLDALFDQQPERVLLVAEACRLKLKQPPLALIQYASVLHNIGCTRLPMAMLKVAGLGASYLSQQAAPLPEPQ